MPVCSGHGQLRDPEVQFQNSGCEPALETRFIAGLDIFGNVLSVEDN